MWKDHMDIAPKHGLSPWTALAMLGWWTPRVSLRSSVQEFLQRRSTRNLLPPMDEGGENVAEGGATWTRSSDTSSLTKMFFPFLSIFFHLSKFRSVDVSLMFFKTFRFQTFSHVTEKSCACAGADTPQLFSLLLHFGASSGHGACGPWQLQLHVEPQAVLCSWKMWLVLK